MIKSISNNISLTTPREVAPTVNQTQKQFSAFLKDSIDNLNKLQNQSDLATEKLVRGQEIDLHEVMIASQKASITLQTTIEIRNKAVEAYQEIMRMQM